MIKSSTFTPTTSVTAYQNTVISKTRVITSVRRMTVTSPTTVAWALAPAATPAAFYIMGGDNGDLHARWHTEDDDHLGNIDFNQPGHLDASLFSLDGNGQLGLTGFSDDTDVYPVRGELVNHPDYQLMIMQAADDGSGEPTTCSIDGTKDVVRLGTCEVVTDFIIEIYYHVEPLAHSNLQKLISELKSNDTSIVSPIGEIDQAYAWDLFFYKNVIYGIYFDRIQGQHADELSPTGNGSDLLWHPDVSSVYGSNGRQAPFLPRYKGEPLEDRRPGGPALVPDHLDDAVSAAVIASAVLIVAAEIIWAYCLNQLVFSRKAVVDAKARTNQLVLCATSAIAILVTLALLLYVWIREYLNPVWNWIPTDPSASSQAFTLESWVCQVGQEITQVGSQNDCRIARAGRAFTIPLFLSFVALAGMAVKEAREDGRTQPVSMPAKQVDSFSLDERSG
ncbi:hypothetical protein TI39_contig455g00010 [Zymoseptoria brevis]|uniref:Uncharacterized protein n=1 Tax=Zymoseptoria brevis TaxID=1047168 RepID=A0A0F4GL99_9PEZI|nr:hypothetical protein TI39_contig455g00010 [Zymoseptoria brevis]